MWIGEDAETTGGEEGGGYGGLEDADDGFRRLFAEDVC